MKRLLVITIILLPLCTWAQTSTRDSLNNLWAHVYKPEKQEVKDSLVQISGKVVRVKGKSNGDYHILLKLDDKYKSLLTKENQTKEKGCLVVIPIFSYKSDSLKPAEIAIKGNYVNHVYIPVKGQRIRVRGSYVWDKKKGWAAIMPVLSIQKIK